MQTEPPLKLSVQPEPSEPRAANRWPRKLKRPPSPAALRLDDIEDAVHHAPVRGERAEIWITARIRRRAELERHGLARLDELGREEHLRDVRHVLLRQAGRRLRQCVGGGAERVE